MPTTTDDRLYFTLSEPERRFALEVLRDRLAQTVGPIMTGRLRSAIDLIAAGDTLFRLSHGHLEAAMTIRRSMDIRSVRLHCRAAQRLADRVHRWIEDGR